MKTPILGASYQARSVNAAADRCVNLMPEVVKAGGLEAGFLSRTPGLKTLFAVGGGPIRGLWSFNGRAFAVSGNKLYEFFPDNSSVLKGYVTGSGPVSMADNGQQLFIACGQKAHIYSSVTDETEEITDEDFPGADHVVFLDGYFIFTEPNSQKVWVTSLYDGYSVNALDFASAEANADKIVSLAVIHREVWLFGESTIEVWYNSGNADFPLTRIQGAFVEIGCAAKSSVAKIDNSVFWLSSDDKGNGLILRSSGYNGQRVSHHGVEYAITTYNTISDAQAFTYRQAGHSFYAITFPTEGKTWVYDVATDMWHERASYINEELTSWRAQCAVNFNNKVIAGDLFSGKIFELDLEYCSDDGGELPWIRAWRAQPTGSTIKNRTVHSSLRIYVEAGVGVIDGQGSEPIINLRWSDDGGHTWSNYHQKSIGKIGEYGKRVIWRRLGATRGIRDRVYEVSGSDPVKIAIMGAEIDGRSGT